MSASPASITKPFTAPRSATRERILDVAEELFARRGLAGASMRDIATNAGIKAASLYNHFEGKQALYEAVLERGIAPLMEILGKFAQRPNPQLEPPSPLDTDPLIEAVMGHLGSRPHLPGLIQHEAIIGGESLERLVREWIRPLMDAAVSAGEHEDSVFDAEDTPLLIAGWLHLIFGHFTLAPLLRGVLGEDPLSPEGLAHQTRFLRKLAALMREEASRNDRNQGDVPCS